MSELSEAIKVLVSAQEEVNRINLKQLKELDVVDEDGYPTDSALEIVELWPWQDPVGWFEFIKTIWWSPEWGWKEKEEDHDWDTGKFVHKYYLSTGGWSGNESIIQAMQNNKLLWSFNWAESRKGGHYIFERNSLK